MFLPYARALVLVFRPKALGQVMQDAVPSPCCRSLNCFLEPSTRSRMRARNHLFARLTRPPERHCCHTHTHTHTYIHTHTYVLLLQSQRRSPAHSVAPTDRAVNAYTLSSSRRVGYKTTRVSPPPQQPKRHLSPVQNSTITTLVHRSDVSSLRTSPSAGVSPKGTRTLAEDHTRRSPVTLLQVTQLFP